MAGKIKAVVMCDSDDKRPQLDAAVAAALEKFPSLVDFQYRKCTPTFRGLPDVFAALETEPHRGQRIMKRMRDEDKKGSAQTQQANYCRIQ